MVKGKGANSAITAIMWTLWCAIIVLLGLLVTIIAKLVSIPPCTVIGQNACAIDGWTVSGISANILAVGGTVLTVLAALAVTAWWVKLDDRIAIQVENQVKNSMEEIRRKQEKDLREYVEYVVDAQKEVINEALSQKDQEIRALTLQLENIRQILSGYGTALLLGIIKHHDPWDLENWVRDIEFRSSSLFYEAEFHMVLSYLRIIDGFKENPEKQKDVLKKKDISEQYNTPLEFWNSALRWEQRVKSQGQPGFISTIEYEINKRKPFIEAWKNSHLDD